ncbi:DUF1287 domain-containing protein [Kangiella marina]|uniref:DUF1287 domain-containing protein n=2 Tax=Kangiella marina TaxID=1079178 RepID=A0ABP8INH9_9GAMM
MMLLLTAPLFSASLKANTLQGQLVDAALERTEHFVVYEGSYRSIDYPMGDVPKNIGVCTDVIIRSYRALGIDLQQLIHEDMTADFGDYPDIWGLTKPDTNIDHRRVPNLERFFERHGETLAVTDKSEDYQPGDIVSWRLEGGFPHIGIVTSKKSETSDNFMIVHNIGLGPKLEDVLFHYPIAGHYRYLHVSSEIPVH